MKVDLLKILALLATCNAISVNADEVEQLAFDMSFYQGEGGEPKVFLSSSGIIAGKYFSSVTVNGRSVGTRKLIITNKEEEEDRLCLEPSFVDAIDLRLTPESMAKAFIKLDRDCIDLGKLDYASVIFNISDQSLIISVPQSYLLASRDGSNSSYGINGLRVTYGINSSASSAGGEALHGQFRGRLNLSDWIIHSDFTGSWTDTDTSDTHMSNLYARRVLPSINSDLTVGKSFVGGNGVVDGFSYGGIGLSSNNRMQGANNSYVPLISGIAKTTSRVVVKQHGRIVHSETITPGPYRIANFMTVGTGDLVVEVKGDDGNVDVKTYPLMTLPSLLREEQFDYNLVLGKRYDGNDIDGLFDSERNFLHFDSKYGLSSVTLEGAFLIDDKYQSLGLGAAFYLGRMGAFSLEGGLSFANYDDGENLQGGTFGVKHAYSVSDKTSVQLAAYKYRNKNYVSYYEFYPEHQGMSRERQKGRVEAMLSHAEDGYNIAVTSWQQTYWDNDSKATGISASLNGRWFDDFSLGFNLNYSKNGGVEDVSGGLSLSMPLQFGKTTHYLSSSLSGGKDSDTVLMTSASGNLSDRLSYGMNVSRDAADVSTSYRSDITQLTAGVSYNDGDSTMLLGVSGSAMWTAPAGLMLSSVQADTIALVGAKGISGVAVNGSYTNENGFAIVGLQPYSDNGLSVDVSTIPFEAEVDTSVALVNPMEGAILYHKLSANKTNRYIVSIRDKFGGDISGGDITSEGVYLGTIAPNGMAVFSLPKVIDAATVSFNDGSRECQINLRGVSVNVKRVHEVVCE